MSESDRRKFSRVLFEARFEVSASEWSDKEATGLDISLNGCRFNCKQSMSDGEIVSIVFKPGLELEGSVRWCWPIEWYFQAALCFEHITQEKQAMLKAYIEEVTGQDYKMQKDEESTPKTNSESVVILEDDLDDIDWTDPEDVTATGFRFSHDSDQYYAERPHIWRAIQREMAEEKKAMADYGSSDSGASLGDILGAALNRARDDGGDPEVAEKTGVENSVLFRELKGQRKLSLEKAIDLDYSDSQSHADK